VTFMRLRDSLLNALRTQSFDVLVIGGGIVGAGVARDAAMRGLRVALIEHGDVASGTSSKTSKLIHGGLRYLEQRQIRLVYESLQERHIWRTIAPQWVWPLSLMIPIYRGDPRPPWQIALGLWCYERLVGSRGFRAHRMMNPSQAERMAPGLRTDELRAAALYVDCQMNDARLCLATLLQAISFGAICCNYVRLVSFERASGRLQGAVVEDVRTGQQFSVRATGLVNATGPWADHIRRLSDPNAPARLAPTKGIHLLVPKLSEQALFVQARADHRMIFLLPWGDSSLIGTTESSDLSSLDDVWANEQEVDYLLSETNRMFPVARVRPADIVATYAGARPLLAFSGSSTQASREHRIEMDRFGLVSVLGGKFTTARRMAAQAVDLIVTRKRFMVERSLTDQISLVEPAQPVVLDRWQDAARRIEPELLARLLATYGAGAFHLLRLLEFEPSLYQLVCPHHEQIQAELVYAIEQELACTVSDLLIRRTPMAFSSCQGLDALSTVADLLQRYGRLSADEVQEQMIAYRQFLVRSLACRGPVPVAIHDAV